MAAGRRSVSRCTITAMLAAVVLLAASGTTEAYDSLDPNGNITIKWDVMQWTPDGYVAVITMYNYQQFRHIGSPGWQLGWTWAKEVIWSIYGAQATEQGDCSKFKGNTPHSCKKSPTIVDLLPGTPYNMQIANCCKAGVISTIYQDPENAASSFQMSVGSAGTSTKTVKLPKKFTLKTPGPGCTCGRAMVVKPSVFFTQDRRRSTQALMTWNVTCTYSQFIATKTPSCCVSLSSFYNKTTVDCITCSCGCQNANGTNCTNDKNSPTRQTAIDGPGKRTDRPSVQCTSHMCPIRVNWHVEDNNQNYWRVKITLTNLRFNMNYTQWNLVLQHPNFDNITQLVGLNYKPLVPYGGDINDIAMFWGEKSHNDLLMQAGKHGTVQGEILFRKDSQTHMFDKGWAFPRRVYFNGDNCVMPPPEAYPWLANIML